MKQNYKLITTLVFSTICMGNCYAFGYFLRGRHVIIGCLDELGYITHKIHLPGTVVRTHSYWEGLDGVSVAALNAWSVII